MDSTANARAAADRLATYNGRCDRGAQLLGQPTSTAAHWIIDYRTIAVASCGKTTANANPLLRRILENRAVLHDDKQILFGVRE
jgi:hypothetical protein